MGYSEDTLQELREIRKGINKLIELHEESFEFSKNAHKKMDEEVRDRMGAFTKMLPDGVDISKMMKDAFEGINQMQGDKRSFDDSVIRKYKREYPKEDEDQDNAAGVDKKDLK